MATAAPANNGQGENEAPKSDAANDPGVAPGAGSNDNNNNAGAASSSSNNATAPGGDAGVLSSGSGASESDQGAAADKGGDKIDNLNNIGLDSGPSTPVNATNIDAKDPREGLEKDPAIRINITESQNVPSLNQSASTKSPEVLPDFTTAARPVQEITVGEVFTTAKRTTASTTKETTTEAKTTFKATTEPILIEFPNSAKTDPPYAIVTDGASPGNVTLIGPEDPGASKNGAAIIASSLGGVLILVIIIAVIVFLLFRRKRRQSKEIVQTVENPRYTLPPTIIRSSPAAVPHQYRFSRDADISIGQGKVSNNNRKAASPMFGKKGLMTNTPSVSGSDISQGSRRLKKRAPAPPNPFGNPDLYERVIISTKYITWTAYEDNPYPFIYHVYALSSRFKGCRRFFLFSCRTGQLQLLVKATYFGTGPTGLQKHIHC